MVQLIVAAKALMASLTLFQFYYGSINREIEESISGETTIFQFYYGSINRDLSKVARTAII